MIGQYIAIEGLDMCGKTTMQKKLIEELTNKNKDVIAVSEPYLEDSSSNIMEILLNATNSNEYKIHSLAKNRETLLKTKILPALSNGINVISSRSFISSLVYQNDDEFDMNKILDTNIKICGTNFKAPDIVAYMPIDYNTYLKRTKMRDSIDSIETKLKSEDYFNMMSDKYEKALGVAMFHMPSIKFIITTSLNDILKEIL